MLRARRLLTVIAGLAILTPDGGAVLARVIVTKRWLSLVVNLNHLTPGPVRVMPFVRRLSLCGQRGDLLAPQAGHAPLAVARPAGLIGRDLGPS
jgi:hypothetical protein